MDRDTTTLLHIQLCVTRLILAEEDLRVANTMVSQGMLGNAATQRNIVSALRDRLHAFVNDIPKS